MTRAELLTATLAHLEDKHSTLFGQFFTLTKPEHRMEAAEWLVGEMQQILERA